MAGTTARAASLAGAPAEAPGRAPARSRDSELASAVKALVVAGQRDRARERFGELVAAQQRRAVRKARARRLKWALPMTLSGDLRVPDRPTPQASVEEMLISDERRRTIGEAVDQLPNRQRAVFTLCHIADQTTSEVSQALGLSEATVRVHLFRAVRKLRTLLAAPEATA